MILLVSIYLKNRFFKHTPNHIETFILNKHDFASN